MSDKLRKKDLFLNKSFYSVFLRREKEKDLNIAYALVEMGLASVVQHRVNEKRSPHYESLIFAERKAQKKKIKENLPKKFQE